MTTEPREACSGHCWHMVGVLKRNTHGPFVATSDADETRVHRCCHCGRQEIPTSTRDIPSEEIRFDPGCDPRSTLQNIAPMATREEPQR